MPAESYNNGGGNMILSQSGGAGFVPPGQPRVRTQSGVIAPLNYNPGDPVENVVIGLDTDTGAARNYCIGDATGLIKARSGLTFTDLSASETYGAAGGGVTLQGIVAEILRRGLVLRSMQITLPTGRTAVNGSISYRRVRAGGNVESQPVATSGWASPYADNGGILQSPAMSSYFDALSGLIFEFPTTAGGVERYTITMAFSHIAERPTLVPIFSE